MKRPLIEWLSIVGTPPQTWVTWARRRARLLYESGIRPQQRLRMADGTEISILLVDENAHIRVSGGGSEFRYQFITTLQENSTYSSGGFNILNGSAVSVRLKARGGVLQYTAEATGSTLEALPDGTEPILSVRDTPRVKAPIQVQLIPEPIYTGYSSTSIDTPKKYTQLLHAWSSVPGVIHNAGFYMPGPTFGDTDKGYDAAPSLITGTTAESRMPDADWPHSACIVTVDSASFGSRRFIVMVDASSTFYCWPTTYENAADEYLYPVDSPYLDQAIKTNVAAANTQSVTPPFPAWVHVPTGQRRDTDWPATVNSGEPRYNWKFHPLGTRVVGTVLSRTVFAATVKGRTTTPSTYLPFTEVDIDDLKINPSRFSGIRGSTQTYAGDLQYDQPGWVEFSLNIVITGPNPADFTFEMTLTREQAADATHYPIAADYLHPVLDGWATYSIDGTPGDLIVLDLASYVDDRGLTWIARNCGYLGDTKYKVRQTWAVVNNIDASGAEMLRFLIKDQPSDFDLRRYDLDAPEMVAYLGRFVHIDLARLSFVYFARLAKYTVDTSDYAHGYTDRNPTTGTVLFGCRQRWEESESGIRYYVFGNKIREERGGNIFGLWSAIDSIALDLSYTRFSPLTTGTRWLASNTGYLSHKHWLTGDIQTKLKYFNPGYYPQVEPSSGIGNRLLETLSSLSSITTGDTYNIPSVSNGDIVTASILCDNGSSQAYIDIFSGWAGPTTSVMLPHQTGILDQLSIGCSSIDRSYFEVLTEWVKEIYEKFITHYNVSTTPINHWNVDYYSGNGPISTGLSYPWNYVYIAYGPGGPGVDEYEYHYTGDTLALYPTINEKPGYSPTYPDAGFDLRPYFYQDEPQFNQYRDYIFETYTNTNLHHRVHNYPIGSEWMINEWTSAIEVDANFSLAVSPEGFYAGHIWLPFISGKIANNTLLADKDYYKEPYFMQSGDPYHSHFNIPVSHIIKSDVIPCIDQYSSYYISYNIPNSSQLGTLDVDTIGHISGWRISHSEAYQNSYNKELDIVSPSVRFTASVDIGYTFEKGVNYNGTTVWSDLISKVSIFNAPRKNGSMLFSK